MPLGYTPDEKARFEQLVKLRRQWLKDQELSPREPVLPHDGKGPVAKFWESFLQPRSLWRIYTYKACNAGWWTLSRLLIPAWVVHYYIKYHVAVISLDFVNNSDSPTSSAAINMGESYDVITQTKPYGIVNVKPRIFPGDTVLETGEVIPPLIEDGHPKHH